MAVNYTKVSPAPALRDPAAVAISSPGLYPNEQGVTLNDINGAHIAVYSEIEWMPNNQGAVIYASARYCNADWSTVLTGSDQHEVVTEKRFSFDAGAVAKFGIDVLAREAMLAVLGEAPNTQTVTNADSTTSQVPIVDLDATTRMNASIRHAIELTQTVGPTNAGALL